MTDSIFKANMPSNDTLEMAKLRRMIKPGAMINARRKAEARRKLEELEKERNI